MSKERRKGTSFENEVVAYLNVNDFPHAERRALAGANDKGDIVGVPDTVIECKNHAKLNLAGWIAEAEREAENARATIPIVWAKKRGVASAGGGYVIMTGATATRLLHAWAIFKSLHRDAK